MKKQEKIEQQKNKINQNKQNTNEADKKIVFNYNEFETNHYGFFSNVKFPFKAKIDSSEVLPFVYC